MFKSVILSIVAVLGLAGASFATDGHVQRVEKIRVVERVVVPQKVVTEYREVPNLRVERVIVNGHHGHAQAVEKIIVRERLVDNHHAQAVRVERVRVNNHHSNVERSVQRSRSRSGRIFGRR